MKRIMGENHVSGSFLQVSLQKQVKEFQLDIAFTAGKGILGILGASGCGKSMALKSVAGIAVPDSGSIVLRHTGNGGEPGGRRGQKTEENKESFREEVFYDSGRQINLPPQRRRVGYLFQNYALFPNMTVEQNIMAGIEGKEGRRFFWMESGSRRQERKRQAAGLIGRFRLEGLERHYPGQLSGGQQQRVALARLLAYEPQVLLLDEPFSAMDAHLREGLRLELIQVLKEFGGITVLVTHDREEAYQLCSRLFLMDRGQAIVSGPSREVFRNPGTVQAARLTGCKNISRIERLAKHRLRALDWGGLELATEQEVGREHIYAGIRSHDLLAVGTEELAAWKRPDANLIPVGEAQASEMPFEWYITLQNGLWWRCRKGSPIHGAANVVPQWMRVEPSAVLLLREGRQGGSKREEGK